MTLFEILNFENWDLFVIWCLPCTILGAGLDIWCLASNAFLIDRTEGEPKERSILCPLQFISSMEEV